MTYALIQDGAIVREAHQVPRTGQNAAGEWVTPPDGEWTPEQAAQVGWQPVTDTPSPDDTATTRYERTVEVVDGVPVVVWEAVEKTENEIQIEYEQNARLDDLDERVRRLEAAVWPAPELPDELFDAPTWEELGKIWYPNTLLLENDKVYRNKTTVPLTEPPSQFPGTDAQWAHLFEVVMSTVDPEPGILPWVQPMGSEDAYSNGDVRTHKDKVWINVIPGVKTNTWEPGVYGWEEVIDE